MVDVGNGLEGKERVELGRTSVDVAGEQLKTRKQL
jgi:hypothetical protein